MTVCCLFRCWAARRTDRRPLRAGAVAGALAALGLAAAGCSSATVPAPVQTIQVEEYQEPVVVRPAFHIVQPGDTLIKIALDHGLDHKDIALWNAIANPDLIDVGQRLRLSEPEDAPVVTPVVPQQVEAEPEHVPVAEPASLQREAGPAAVEPETRVIGGDVALVEQIPLTAAVFKKGPKAASHPYSKAKLEELERQAAEVDPDELAYASAARPGLAPPAEVKAEAGNEWGWPIGGQPSVLQEFTADARGIDLGGSPGDPVYASADGKVLYVGSGMSGYGNLVVIRHENDYVSAYANNEQVLVQADQAVRRGDLIARMGRTGASRVQLHFEIRKSGQPVDPLRFMPEKRAQ